jgi:hypothetical protein
VLVKVHLLALLAVPVKAQEKASPYLYGSFKSPSQHLL